MHNITEKLGKDAFQYKYCRSVISFPLAKLTSAKAKKKKKKKKKLQMESQYAILKILTVNIINGSIIVSVDIIQT